MAGTDLMADDYANGGLYSDSVGLRPRQRQT